MLPGWAYFRDKVPFCKKKVAKEVGGHIFEVGVFCETTVLLTKLLRLIARSGLPHDVLHIH